MSEAEYETRDGNEHYDVGGSLPDGSELELDITRIDGVWTVMETQRDIELETIPEAVAKALHRKVPGWSADRIIESDQAEVLVDDWAH